MSNAEQLAPEVHREITAAVDELSPLLREPIVYATPDYVADHQAEVDGEWLLVSEAMRRAIIREPDTRAAAAAFATAPLSEKLPEQAVEALSGTPRVGRIAARQTVLREYIGLDAVPESAISRTGANGHEVNDITNAKMLLTKESLLDDLEMSVRIYAKDIGQRKASLQQELAQGSGISGAERSMIAHRYRMARDVKLLSLGAELQDNPVDARPDEQGLITHILPSGAKIVAPAEVMQQSPGLFDPTQWTGRTQLKDRVHIVQAAGQQFILKERKTNRHTDVKKNGHIDGNTSAQEFAAARHFQEVGTVKQGSDISLSWERPLGYVEFPDGYQFAMFEHLSDMEFSADPRSGGLGGLRQRLAETILEHPEEYQQEYKELRKAAAAELRRDPILWTMAGQRPPQTKRFSFSRITRKQRQAADEQYNLTYEDFADVKALAIMERSRELLRDALPENGYTNSDTDGFGYTVKPGPRAAVHVTAFDFEYYIPDARSRAFNADMANFLNNMPAPINVAPRPIGQAAYRVLGNRNSRRRHQNQAL